MTRQSVFSNLLNSVFLYFWTFGNLEDLAHYLAQRVNIMLV